MFVYLFLKQIATFEKQIQKKTKPRRFKLQKKNLPTQNTKYF